MDITRLKKTIYARYRGICGSCLVRQANAIHHILPYSAGGEDNEGNMITVCNQCHQEIHDTGWDKHVERLHQQQAKAKALLNSKIVVGGDHATLGQ